MKHTVPRTLGNKESSGAAQSDNSQQKEKKQSPLHTAVASPHFQIILSHSSFPSLPLKRGRVVKDEVHEDSHNRIDEQRVGLETK